jgi:hypothetical protein
VISGQKLMREIECCLEILWKLSRQRSHY